MAPTPLLKALFLEHRLPLRYKVKINNFRKFIFGYTIYKNKNTNFIPIKQTYSNYHDLMCLDDIWERDEYAQFNLKLNCNSTVIDIGANIGAFTCFIAANYPGSKIISYEPDPRNYKLSNKNIKLNKFSNIKIFNQAVFDKKCKMTLYINSVASASNSMFNQVQKDKSIDVECISLKSIFDSNKIAKCNLLKIDTEGAEYKILNSFPVKYFDRVDNIIIEFHEGIKNIEKILKKAGFKNKIFFMDAHIKTKKFGIIYGKK